MRTGIFLADHSLPERLTTYKGRTALNMTKLIMFVQMYGFPNNIGVPYDLVSKWSEPMKYLKRCPACDARSILVIYPYEHHRYILYPDAMLHRVQ